MSEPITIAREEIRRTIGVIDGEPTGRHVVYFAGIHGNEPAGILALQNVIRRIQNEHIPLHGKLWAISGNLPALNEGKRFIDRDLNRIWFVDEEHSAQHTTEDRQKAELEAKIREVVEEANEEVLFFDLHTTSAQSVPFVSISDTLRNRKIIEDIPVPLILGLEEQMEGTLFSFFSEIGISMVLFEAGQHDAQSSVDSHEAFIWLTLLKLGFVRNADLPDAHEYYTRLAREGVFDRNVFQLKYKHLLKEDNQFVMEPGFVNFQRVHKGQTLAHDSGAAVMSTHNGRIFMPLYQSQGIEGFFIIREVNPFWLGVSEHLRKLQVDRLLHLFPGIQRTSKTPLTFLVHRYVARITLVPIFHLLGYRVVIRQDNKFIVKRRPFDWERPPMQHVKLEVNRLLG